MDKICYISLYRDTAIFYFPNISDYILKTLLTYKRWYDEEEAQTISYMRVLPSENGTLLETKDCVGFVPIIVNYLQKLDFHIFNINTDNNLSPVNSTDIKYFDVSYKSINVIFPHFRYVLRDYQFEFEIKWFKDKLGVIKAPTASGKTIVAGHIMYKVGKKTLILVHTIELIEMWYEKLSKMFGESFLHRVGIFGDKKNISDVLHKNVIIGTYQTALKEDTMSKLKILGFGLLICDECHHVPAKTFRNVVKRLMIPYKLGLSATPRRLDNKEGDIFGLMDNIKASISIRKLIEKGNVVEPIFYNIYWENKQIINHLSGFWGLKKVNKLKKLSATSVEKYSMILKLVDKLVKENKTFLIYTDYKISAEKISMYINHKYDSDSKYKCKVAYVSSKIKKNRSEFFDKLGKEYNGLIFARLGGEGIDIPAVDCIINNKPSKSPVTFAQRTGRAMRPSTGKSFCEVYQFVLMNSKEEEWSVFSFDEYRQENFIQLKYSLQ